MKGANDNHDLALGEGVHLQKSNFPLEASSQILLTSGILRRPALCLRSPPTRATPPYLPTLLRACYWAIFNGMTIIR